MSGHFQHFLEYTGVVILSSPRFNCLFKSLGVILLFSSGAALADPPGPAVPVVPAGVITDSTPTYIWSEVNSSTYYRLWVQDSSGVIINRWYKSAELDCTFGCSVTPAEVVANGSANYWVQTWNPDGVGPWSAASAFSLGGDGIPVAADLTGPIGTATTTPTYTWNAVANSSWYRLWVEDVTGIKLQQWYTAAEANCAGGAGTCTITPATTLAPGAARFWVRTWNHVGAGPWSAVGNFAVGGGGNPGSVACNAPNAQVQAALLDVINTLRSTPTMCNGVAIPARPPLAWSNELGAAAQGHSNDMAANNYFDHTGLDGSNFDDRATAAGYAGFATGENIAAGSGTVDDVVNLNWVTSTAGHCEYLMTESTEMGAGCGHNPNSTYTNYWTFQAGNPN